MKKEPYSPVTVDSVVSTATQSKTLSLIYFIYFFTSDELCLCHSVFRLEEIKNACYCSTGPFVRWKTVIESEGHYPSGLPSEQCQGAGRSEGFSRTLCDLAVCGHSPECSLSETKPSPCTYSPLREHLMLCSYSPSLTISSTPSTALTLQSGGNTDFGTAPTQSMF